MTMRGGFAYQFAVASIHSFTAAADADYRIYEKQWGGAVGLEYFWMRNYGMRMGYKILSDSLGLTIGFGARWHGRIMLDYAWGLSDGLSDSHRVTLSYRFGGVSAAARSRERRPDIEPVSERSDFRDLDRKKPAAQPGTKKRRTQRNDGVPGWIY
jgi:hypothetical protein